MGKKREWLEFLAVFLTAFCLAFFRVKYFVPVDLVVQGEAVFPAQLKIDWDSGRGFNMLEQHEHGLEAFAPGVLEIKRVGDRSSASQGSDVWIEAIFTERGERVSLEKLAEQQGLELVDFFGTRIIKLTERAPAVKLPDAGRPLKVRFLTNDSSGHVSMMSGVGNNGSYDLYSTERSALEKKHQIKPPADKCFKDKCPFFVRVSLSPDPIRAVRVRSSTLLEGATFVLETPQDREQLASSSDSGSYFDIKVQRPINEQFNGVLLGAQIFFAAIVALIFVVTRRHLPPLRRLLGREFSLFWSLFVWFVVCSSLWWFAYWPVAFSPDSLFTWRTARRLTFYDDSHPFLNVFYVLFLRQLWDNPAVISLFQLAVTSLLAATIFFYCFKKGAGRTLVLFFALLFSLSVPMGVYSITLWRDVPFALLLVGWAFFLVILRDNAHIRERVKFPEMVLMSVSLIFLLLRHNGKLSILIIPILIFLFQLLPVRKSVALGVAVGALFYFTQTVLRLNILGIHFLYPPDILRGWQNDLSVDRLVPKLTDTILGFFNSLDIIMNSRETNIWRGSWGGTASAGEYLYNADVDAGYIKYQALSPAVRVLADALLAGSYRLPFVFFQWNPAILLYFFVFPLLCWRTFPRTAVFSLVISSQTVALIFFTSSINWRYFYFQWFACLFIVPILSLDWRGSPIRLPRTWVWVLLGVGLVMGLAEFVSPKFIGDSAVARNIYRYAGSKSPLERSPYLPFSTPVSSEWYDEEFAPKYYYFDSMGMRTAQVGERSQDNGARSVLLLGDEALFGRGLEFGTTVAGQLSRLSPQFERPTKFVNAALTAGGSPDSYYAYLQAGGLSKPPAFVVVMLSPENDLFNLASNNWTRLDEFDLPRVVSSNRLQLDSAGAILNMNMLPRSHRISLWSESRLFSAAAGFLNSCVWGTDITKGLARRMLPEAEAWNRMQLSLRGLRKVVRGAGAGIVVVILPDEQSENRWPKAPSRLIEMLKRLKIPRIDLTSKIRAVKRSSDGAAPMAAEEHQQIAESIASFLREYDDRRRL